ncbi:tyrosine-type recombinase/integrase [Streptomyces globisporus]|uniref:tyrosine-type recombinase/integrase n=1 Tax=Streptomyces globisporus TaxID=1908 RepID=UPI003460CB50
MAGVLPRRAQGLPVAVLRLHPRRPFRAAAAADCRDPWADQFPRDSWDLRLLDLANEDCCRLHFGGNVQPWLRDLAKRWARWRLTRGSKPAGLTLSVQAIARLARHMAGVDGVDAGPSTLNRARIETWLATLQAEGQRYVPLPHRQLCWRLPARRPPLRVAAGPGPQRVHLRRRAQTARAEAAVHPREPHAAVGGARVRRTASLRGRTAYLAWLNRKIQDRPAFFPLSEDLAVEIGHQRQAVLERFPEGCKWIFLASLKNVDGSKPVSDRRMRDHLAIWLEPLSLTDEHDKPVKVTFHQFRHTLATRMINADVPQPVIQTLLDHMSPAMTAVYAKLHDKTLRRHWENALKVNHGVQQAEIAANHPLAGATWAKMSLVRAKVTLPNGY